MSKAKNIFRIGTRALAITTIVRQVRLAREEGDKLRVFDAVVNGLAIGTAILILVREVREQAGNTGKAVEKAPL